MGKVAARRIEDSELHDQWDDKLLARETAWREFVQVLQMITAKQAAVLHGHQEANPTIAELERMQEAKKRCEKLAGELSELAERMARAG